MACFLRRAGVLTADEPRWLGSCGAEFDARCGAVRCGAACRGTLFVGVVGTTDHIVEVLAQIRRGSGYDLPVLRALRPGRGRPRRRDCAEAALHRHLRDRAGGEPHAGARPSGRGAVQGIGGALLEEVRYDEDGRPHDLFIDDYQLPRAVGVPAVGVPAVRVPAVGVPAVGVHLFEDALAPGNPLGVRGALQLRCGVGALLLRPRRVRAVQDSRAGVETDHQRQEPRELRLDVLQTQ